MEALPLIAASDLLAQGSLPVTPSVPLHEPPSPPAAAPLRAREIRAESEPTTHAAGVSYALFRRKRDPHAPLRPSGVTPQDAAWYPLREDLSEVEGPIHARITSYFHEAIPILQPTCGVERAVGVYLQEGDDEACLEADILVTQPPYANPDKEEQVIRAWLVGRLLFACEVVSGSNTRVHLEAKQRVYERTLRVEEYLEIDPQRRRMVLYRLAEGKYGKVDPDAAGRLWSRSLGVGFEMGERGFVWMVKPDGRRIQRHQADHARAEAEYRRAEAEHQRAEAEHQEVTSTRQQLDAERQRAESAEQQLEAEKARAEAALEELARMQARLALLLGEALASSGPESPSGTSGGDS